jgi:hypothetical protein
MEQLSERSMFQEGLRLVAEQELSIDRVRTRALILFAAATVSTSFLVGQVLPISALSFIGMACFVGIGVSTAVVLSPGTGKSAEVEIEHFLQSVSRTGSVQPDVDIESISRLKERFEANRIRLARSSHILQAGVILLIAEMVISISNVLRA